MPKPPAAVRKDASGPGSPRWPVVLGAALLVAAVMACYANTFQVPFLFDDRLAIAGNASVKDMARMAEVLRPGSLTTSGRPVLNLSFALNYAWTGEGVWSYHLVNLAIHLGSTLALFGVVRRTLLSPSLIGRFGPAALPLAGVIALLWALHPLQTNAVTYISERAEALMGAFYLLALYGLIRGREVGGGKRWALLSLVSCYLGMGTKETMVTAPFLLLVFDRIFLADSFRQALFSRRGYYVGLFGSWVWLGYLMIATHHEIPGIGFDSGVDWRSYTLTSFKVVAWYLKLAVWPHPQVFDYGPEMLEHALLPVLPYVLVVLAGIAATIGLLARGKPAAGFLAAAFFILLSPTTSFVPVLGQPMAESRMYLPVAAVLTLAVAGFYAWSSRWTLRAACVVALIFAGLTVARNRDYQSELSIWQDSIAQRPMNSRGQLNLAIALAKVPGRLSEAIAHGEEAVRLRPDFPEAHYNLACALAEIPGRRPEAIAHYEMALRQRADLPEAHNNLANELARDPARVAEAISHYEAALRLRPDYAEAHANLAGKLARFPERVPQAIAHYEEALRLRPALAEAHYNYANLLANLPGRLPDAVTRYEAALRLNPELPQAHKNLALALANLGRLDEARAHLIMALRLRPDYGEAAELLKRVEAAR